MPNLPAADHQVQEALNRISSAQRCLDAALRQLDPVIGAELRGAEIRNLREQVREEWHRIHKWWVKRGSFLEVTEHA